jgi:hypothetical protein
MKSKISTSVWWSATTTSVQVAHAGKSRLMRRRCKKHHHTGAGKQILLRVGCRKLRGWENKDGGIMLYPQRSQNASTQGIQITTRPAKIWWFARTRVLDKNYLQAVKILGGSKATAMQSLQLHLTGAARSWLSKLPKESIGNWNELEKQFTRNFRSTYTWPSSIEELKACTQKSNESLRS